MKIFVLHCSKLVERKSHILDLFSKQNITNYEFIENYDKDDIESESKFYSKEYKRSTMSLHLKHLYVYKLLAQGTEDALVFEDDIILCDNFMETLNKYLSQLPTDYDMLFLGNGCNLHIEKEKILPHKFIYEKGLYPTSWGGNGASRCTDSYLISNACAKKMFGYVKKINSTIKLPIDWWINEAARNINLKVYWAEPTIVSQGTHTGLFSGSI